jgi:hypothetical protein
VSTLLDIGIKERANNTVRRARRSTRDVPIDGERAKDRKGQDDNQKQNKQETTNGAKTQEPSPGLDAQPSATIKLSFFRALPISPPFFPFSF